MTLDDLIKVLPDKNRARLLKELWVSPDMWEEIRRLVAFDCTLMDVYIWNVHILVDKFLPSQTIAEKYEDGYIRVVKVRPADLNGHLGAGPR